MIKQKLRITVILCFLINTILSIGQTSIPQNVEIALSKAGKNKEELKKVILHYQKLKDNQKLQAAYFLIANMPEHYSEDYIWTDETGKNLNFDELKYPDMENSLKAFSQLKIKTKIRGKTITYKDVDVVSSGLLIRNIDLAFEVWKKPWNKNLSFEDFCEYILPYRVCIEPLQDWRQTFYNRFSPFISQLKNGGKDYELCNLVNENLKTWFVETYGLEKRQEKLPLLGPLNLLHRKQGECPDMVNLTVYAMRSVGVACCMDFAPYWPTSSGGHYWNLTFDQNGKPMMFMGVTHNPGTYLIDRELAKVFRMTYAKQNNSLAALAKPDEIPEEFLKTPYIKDVTSNYVKTQHVKIQSFIRNLPNIRFAFLSVFNYSDWRITDWAKLEMQSGCNCAEFKNIGQGCMYLPVIYHEKRKSPISYPFSISLSGEKWFYKPDTEHKQTISLHQQDGYLIYRSEKKYTLYFWNNKWIEQETQTYHGDKPFLIFKNVPANAVFLLRPEYSQGKERIFTIDNNGNRIWW